MHQLYVISICTDTVKTFVRIGGKGRKINMVPYILPTYISARLNRRVFDQVTFGNRDNQLIANALFHFRPHCIFLMFRTISV